MADNSNIILLNIKRMLGIPSDVEEFDIDLISYINGAFFSLKQLGVGQDGLFEIDEFTEWSAFDSNVSKDVLTQYIYLKTKLIFDPPTASNILEAYKDRLDELEFRIGIAVDNGGGVVSG